MHGVVVRGRVRHEVTVSSGCVVFCEQLSIKCMAVTSWDGKPPMVYASIPEVGRWNGGGLFLAVTKRPAPSPVSRSMAVLFLFLGNPIVLHGVGCRYFALLGIFGGMKICPDCLAMWLARFAWPARESGRPDRLSL